MSERLYTPELLALAVELADHAPLQDAPFSGQARSATCGSTLAMDLTVDEAGRVETLGMRVQACAVGQAAAAIYARHAAGRDEAALRDAHDRLRAWLQGEGAEPDWPDLALIAPARDYPGRHGAILLPWKAALAALDADRQGSESDAEAETEADLPPGPDAPSGPSSDR